MKITVTVPDRDNLQFASFWIALYGGFFEKEGVEVELLVSPGPAVTGNFFLEHPDSMAAVLPPPIFLGLVSRRAPVVLGANLLKNDPIALIVRRSEAEARHVTSDMPVHDRLVALKGIALGVAPHPPSRLRTLYRAQGMDADHDLAITILRGKDQNGAFTRHEVDALYAHTPFLERALVHDDAVVIVNQSRGEIPELANRQIHGLVFRRGFVELQRPTAVSMVKAIAAAEASIHASPSSAVATLVKSFPARDPKELEVFVKMYEPAIPDTPAVVPIDAPRWLALFPDGTPPPDLNGIDLAPFVATDLYAAPKPAGPSMWPLLVVLGFAVLAILGVIRRTSAKESSSLRRRTF